MDELRDAQLHVALLASPIEDERDLLGGARADLAEGREPHLKERNRDRRGQMEDRPVMLRAILGSSHGMRNDM